MGDSENRGPTGLGPDIASPSVWRGEEERSPGGQIFLTKGAALLFLAVALERLTCTTPDPDLWGYMAFGRLFWQTGGFPYRDVFAYLPTLNPWVYHEWLTGVLLYPLYESAGAPGLQVLKYVLGLAAVALIYLTARLRGATPLAAILSLVLVQPFLGVGYSPVRAQIFTYAFFALTLYLLERARNTGRWLALWILIPLQVIWANLHGGFLAGLGLLALYALGEGLSRRPFLFYLPVFLTAALATALNPYGLEYWRYLAAALSMPRPEITEWVSAYQAWGKGMFFREFLIFFLVAAFALFLSVRVRWRELTPFLALGLTFILGVKHLRHQVFFFILTGAYLAVPLTRYLTLMQADPKLQALGKIGRRLGWPWPALLLAGGLAYYGYLIAAPGPLSFRLPSLPPPPGKTAMYYPTGAVAFIQEHKLSGNLLTDFDWGEYLIWTLAPRCRVSLDGRFETVYPADICREYFAFIYARPGWRQFLAKYPPDLILVDCRSRICRLLQDEPGWRQVYQDAGSALFRRLP
uniref:Glycosyltransferase RgtA/B/C/D-like domain-containing protein n=1 Tax=Desulfobacca acetoxidans TaxID=60893 RepID=A0A7C3WP91_9BACT